MDEDVSETGVEVDIDGLPELLERAAWLIESGLGSDEIDKVLAVAENLEPGDEVEVEIPVRWGDADTALSIRFYALQEQDVFEVVFVALPGLIEEIEGAIDDWVDEDEDEKEA